MTQAFENPQFKELFLDYVKEIENPDNKAKYEEEIRQMERERGIEAKFIHPDPKECLHTKENMTKNNEKSTPAPGCDFGAIRGRFLIDFGHILA